MAATSTQRALLSKVLKKSRRRIGLTQREVALALLVAGHDVTVQAVSGWEKGDYAPSSKELAIALDEAVEAGGVIVEILGYTEPEPTRIEALEREVADLRSTVEEALALLRAARPQQGESTQSQPRARPTGRHRPA